MCKLKVWKIWEWYNYGISLDTITWVKKRRISYRVRNYIQCFFRTMKHHPTICQFSSVPQLCLTLCNPLDCSMPGFPVHPRACSNSCPLSQWYHPTISSSVVPFSCLQSFPASGSFPLSQLFASGSQSTEVSASASVLPVNIQDWFPLGLTGLISLQSKGLSREFKAI